MGICCIGEFLLRQCSDSDCSIDTIYLGPCLLSEATFPQEPNLHPGQPFVSRHDIFTLAHACKKLTAKKQEASLIIIVTFPLSTCKQNHHPKIPGFCLLHRYFSIHW